MFELSKSGGGSAGSEDGSVPPLPVTASDGCDGENRLGESCGEVDAGGKPLRVRGGIAGLGSLRGEAELVERGPLPELKVGWLGAFRFVVLGFLLGTLVAGER